MTTFSQTCSITTVSLGTLAGLTSQAQPSVAGGNVKVIVLPFGHTSQKLNSFTQSQTPILSGIANNNYSVAGGNIANILTYTATPFHSGITKLISLVSAMLPSLSGASNNLQPNVPGGNVGEIVTLTATPIGLTKLINLLSANVMAPLQLGTKLVSAVTYLCSGAYFLATATKASVLHPVTPSMTNAFLVTIARNISWIRTPLIGEIVSVQRGIAKTIAFVSLQLLTLQKNEVYLINLASNSLLTLVKSINKIIPLAKIGEILSLTTVSGHMNTKAITMLTANILTETGHYLKNIYLFAGELISLTKYTSKTIFMYLAELLTTNQGKKIYLVTANLFLHQLLKFSLVKTQVARRPIKIIPLNFEYQLPFSYTQAPTNPIYVNDAATVFMTPSEPVSASQAIAMRITAPNGIAVTRYYPLVWISQIPSWSEAGDAQNLTTFAVTQFDPGELNQVGYWSITLIYNGISAQNGTFYVGPAP